MKEPRFVVLRHDCEYHTHDFAIYGPFTSEQDADDWVDRTDAGFPKDGGYAFAAVLLAVVDDEQLSDPDDLEPGEGDDEDEGDGE